MHNDIPGEQMPAGRTPFNLKTILTGILCSVIMTVMAQYSANVVNGSFMAIDHMPAGGVFIFLLLVLFLNPLLKMLSGDRLSFSPAEQLVIYTMVLVTASVAEMGLGCQLIPILAAPSYYATPENQWAEKILPYIKPWLAPKDPNITRPFFEGLPRGASIPWGAWTLPLFAWGIFLMALYFVTICAVSILRREWVEREKLAFPLAQLPIAMVQPGKGRIPALFHSKIFWLGFVIPFVISCLIGLHHYFEIVPRPRLENSIPIFRGTGNLNYYLSFPILGFSYLISLETSFSLWFFNLLFLVLKGWFNVTGISSSENVGIYGAGGNAIMSNIGTGAFLAFVLYGLFLSRQHLKDVFRKAIGRGKDVDDSGEVMSYRAAFWGLVAGLIFLLVWLRLAGLNAGTAFLFLAGILIIWIGLTRVVSEGGVATLVGPSIPSSQVVSALGSRIIGPESLTNLGLQYVYASDLRTFPASSVMHSEKIAERFGKAPLRPLFWLMLLAILIGFALSSVLMLKLAYTKGGINLNSWYFVGAPQAPYSYVVSYLNNPAGPNKLGWICRSCGALVMLGLMIMRNRFVWWPLHPLGFTVGMVWLIDRLWFSIFLAWLLKTLLIRYGGPRIYESGKPFFFGLILGQYSAAAVWFLIDLLLHTTNNVIFWI